MLASETLKDGFRLDVDPILKKARLDADGAIDPIASYRASGYRAGLAAKRPPITRSGSGIV